ncbi:MAG TPA: type II secretion system protein [Candidatus Binatia bacterium]|nr:type II secretion system protein [Candidatus Binatia bacterium]
MIAAHRHTCGFRLAGLGISMAGHACGSPTRAPAACRHGRGRCPRDAGFSLLELLVVVAILGILVAAALPRFSEFRAAAYDTRSQQDLRNLAAAQELYRATNAKYSSDASALGGFTVSEGVELTIQSADETTWSASATHPAGSRTFRWDSSAESPLTSAAH